jgi:hypothetical protein
MSLTTSAGLQAAAADWLNRADLTAQIPDFIALAEAGFNRELRLRDMLTRSTATTTNEFVPVPADWLGTYSFELQAPDKTYMPSLEYVNQAQAKQIKAVGATGSIRYYTMINAQFELLPAPTAATALTLTYWASVPPLATNTTNWLLLKAPDLYLATVLLAAAPYLKNDERIPVWAGSRQQIIEALTLESDRATRSTTSLVARKRTF